MDGAVDLATLEAQTCARGTSSSSPALSSASSETAPREHEAGTLICDVLVLVPMPGVWTRDRGESGNRDNVWRWRHCCHRQPQVVDAVNVGDQVLLHEEATSAKASCRWVGCGPIGILSTQDRNWIRVCDHVGCADVYDLSVVRGKEVTVVGSCQIGLWIELAML